MTHAARKPKQPADLAPVANPADLHHLWTTLMGPLGFSRRRLWLAFIGPDGTPTPHLTQIDEIPPRADPDLCAPLLDVCAHIVAEDVSGGSVAILYTRPGRHPMSGEDRSWAIGLTEAARAQGVRMWPVHFANDEVLQVFAPDDLTLGLAG